MVQAKVIIVMGVSGAGKTTVGRLLAERLRLKFFEGDDLHSMNSKAKMQAGIALTDADRQPWLEAIGKLISELLDRHESAIISCSALKQAYRSKIGRQGVCFAYLRIPLEVARQRLSRRGPHFFNPTLLESQFAALEEPVDALVIDARESPDQVVDAVVARLPQCLL